MCVCVGAHVCFTCCPPGTRDTSRGKFFMTILNPLDSQNKTELSRTVFYSCVSYYLFICWCISPICRYCLKLRCLYIVLPATFYVTKHQLAPKVLERFLGKKPPVDVHEDKLLFCNLFLSIAKSPSLSLYHAPGEKSGEPHHRRPGFKPQCWSVSDSEKGKCVFLSCLRTVGNLKGHVFMGCHVSVHTQGGYA